MNNIEATEYKLDLPKGKKLLLLVDKKLSIDIRRLLAEILKSSINDMNSILANNDDYHGAEGWFYVNFCDLRPNVDLGPRYHDSVDLINSLLEASKNTSIVWFHEYEEGIPIFNGWASLIGEISVTDRQLIQYYVPVSVCHYLKDKSIASWILASLEKVKFPQII